MPPKKEVKEKAAKGDEAEEMVLQYLKNVNRPYASTDVSANLKNKVPKALAQKIMQTLSDRGDLTLKPYGKQTIFVYNQSNLKVLATEEMTQLDENLKAIQDEVSEKRKEVTTLEKELSIMESTPKTKDIVATIQAATAENDKIKQSLEPFRASGKTAIKPMTPEEIKLIDDDFVKWRKYWVDRRKLYRELLGMLTDSGQVVSVPEFEENQGITVDEDEAKAIDQGEFCKPQPVKRIPAKTKAPVSAAPVSDQGKKRVPSTATTGSDDGGKKKKAKKV